MPQVTTIQGSILKGYTVKAMAYGVVPPVPPTPPVPPAPPTPVASAARKQYSRVEITMGIKI